MGYLPDNSQLLFKDKEFLCSSVSSLTTHLSLQCCICLYGAGNNFQCYGGQPSMLVLLPGLAEDNTSAAPYCMQMM